MGARNFLVVAMVLYALQGVGLQTREVVMNVRIAFGVTLLFVLGVHSWIRKKIVRENCQTDVEFKVTNNDGSVDINTIPTRDYDLKFCRNASYNIFSTAIFVTLIHGVAGWVQPLVVQVPVLLLGLWDFPLFQIYVVGSKKPFKRPFNTDSKDSNNTQHQQNTTNTNTTTTTTTNQQPQNNNTTPNNNKNKSSTPQTPQPPTNNNNDNNNNDTTTTTQKTNTNANNSATVANNSAQKTAKATQRLTKAEKQRIEEEKAKWE